MPQQIDFSSPQLTKVTGGTHAVSWSQGSPTVGEAEERPPRDSGPYLFRPLAHALDLWGHP